jgi:hypothetical protein
MSILHQLAPIFFVVQFGLVLAGLAAAMLLADPQTLLPLRKRRKTVRPALSRYRTLDMTARRM